MNLLLVFLGFILVTVEEISASTEAPRCESTGQTCLNVEDCPGKPNGAYQWCGSCTKQLGCSNGVGTLYSYFNPSYTQWDDHKKNFEAVSTTCRECVQECPSGPSVPPNPSDPICDNTGLGCIPAPNFCGVQPSAGNYQYCGNCSCYIYCGGLSGGSSLLVCPQGTFYDHNIRDCTSQSSTCRECTDPYCKEPAVEIQTTQQPTTKEITSEPTTTSEPICESTGPVCMTAEACLWTVNGFYQWCGSCTKQLRCLDGVGTLYSYFNPSYTQWDDHKKSFEAVSTTCLECFHQCPPGPSAPTNPSDPICDSTGLGCIPGPNFCGVQPPTDNYQYCGNCSYYIYCGGLSGGSSWQACPQGTFYDHNIRGCTSQSSTCNECYAACGEQTVGTHTTQQPTTQTSTSAPSTTSAPRCDSTGPVCLNVADCPGKPDGFYQWCGNCTQQLRCLGGVGTLYSYFNPSYTQWDDHKKSFEAVSTTCLECFHQCPPGPSAPTNPSDPICDSTGLGCIPSPNFCAIQPPAGSYQYCGNCSHYIFCGGLSGGSILQACPQGTFYDHDSRDCISQSSTCNECYAPCDGSTRPASTTVIASTTAMRQTSDSHHTSASDVVTALGDSTLTRIGDQFSTAIHTQRATSTSSTQASPTTKSSDSTKATSAIMEVTHNLTQDTGTATEESSTVTTTSGGSTIKTILGLRFSNLLIILVISYIATQR